MEILKLLQKKSNRFYVSMLLFGIINSLWNFGLLGIINTTLQGTALPLLPGYNWQIFFVLVVFSLVSNKFFQNFMIKLTNDLSYELSVSVVDKLRFASYEDFESVGKEKVYAALQDAQQISSIPRTFIESFNSVIIVMCSFVYLTWISPIGGILLISAVLLVMLFFIYRNKRIEQDLNVVRDLQNDYFAYLNDLLLGFKEIKMGVSRNDNLFFKFLEKNRRTTRDIVANAQYKYVNNDLVGNYSLYLVIGVVLFVLPVIYKSSSGELTSFIIAILYAIGPISMLINMIPTFTRLKISVERIGEFDHKLDALTMSRIQHGQSLNLVDSFQSIRFEEVEYQYYDKNKRRSFLLGPINLEIRKGELIFITGGNGSGKSTFINLLTGLCKPLSGKIFLNDQEITLENYPQYRNYISAIFSDNYLFSENYDEFDLRLMNTDFKEYLEIMQLADIIRHNPDKNKVDHSLSKGQSKRLAMIFTQMENRSVWVLDEWAADQDPEFKDYFYKTLLRDLKAKGKTMVVITHDDTYFHCAERMIKFDFGKIVRDEILAPALVYDK